MYKLYKKATNKFIKENKDLASLKRYALEFKDILYIKSDGIKIWNNDVGDNENIRLF